MLASDEEQGREPGHQRPARLIEAVAEGCQRLQGAMQTCCYQGGHCHRPEKRRPRLRASSEEGMQGMVYLRQACFFWGKSDWAERLDTREDARTSSKQSPKTASDS